MNAQVVSSAKRPTIVFMLTRNLGYGELGCYGGGILRGAPTPRIDKLSSEGLRLLNFNVEAQCTPSRSAFIAGAEVPTDRAIDGVDQLDFFLGKQENSNREEFPA